MHLSKYVQVYIGHLKSLKIKERKAFFCTHRWCTEHDQCHIITTPVTQISIKLVEVCSRNSVSCWHLNPLHTGHWHWASRSPYMKWSQSFSSLKVKNLKKKHMWKNSSSKVLWDSMQGSKIVWAGRTQQKTNYVSLHIFIHSLLLNSKPKRVHV